MALTNFPEIQSLNVSDARRQFSETLDRVRLREVRVVVEKSGIPVGAIVSMEDLTRLKIMDDDRIALLDSLGDTRNAFAGIPAEEIEAEIEKAIAAVDAGDPVALNGQPAVPTKQCE